VAEQEELASRPLFPSGTVQTIAHEENERVLYQFSLRFAEGF